MMQEDINKEQTAAEEQPLEQEEQQQEQPEQPVDEQDGQQGGHKDRKRRKIAEQAQQIKQLTEDLDKAREEASDAKDQYLRLQAEWDNYRRRTAKERLELIDNAGKDVLLGFLPVVDDCQRALKVLRESDASEAAVEGTELIYNKLMAYLKQRGVEPIEARGAAFDTDYHEAVAQFPVEDPEKKNTVIDVTQEGYTLNGNVIRFAKVVVGI